LFHIRICSTVVSRNPNHPVSGEEKEIRIIKEIFPKLKDDFGKFLTDCFKKSQFWTSSRKTKMLNSGDSHGTGK
jgi:hypothetical protein